MTKKITCKKLRAWIKEEKQASKMYKAHGFPSQSNDEHNHSIYFTEIAKQKGCKV